MCPNDPAFANIKVQHFLLAINSSPTERTAKAELEPLRRFLRSGYRRSRVKYQSHPHSNLFFFFRLFTYMRNKKIVFTIYHQIYLINSKLQTQTK